MSLSQRKSVRLRDLARHRQIRDQEHNEQIEDQQNNENIHSQNLQDLFTPRNRVIEVQIPRTLNSSRRNANQQHVNTIRDDNSVKISSMISKTKHTVRTNKYIIASTLLFTVVILNIILIFMKLNDLERTISELGKSIELMTHSDPVIVIDTPRGSARSTLSLNYNNKI